MQIHRFKQFIALRHEFKFKQQILVGTECTRSKNIKYS